MREAYYMGESKMRRAAIFLTIFALGGCASTHALKETDRNAITTVAVSPDVRVSPDLYYLGPGTSLGMMFGAVGGAIAASASTTSADELKTFAKSNNISIGEIVRKQFVGQLLTTGKFHLTDGTADAVFKLDVSQYGLSVPNGLSSSLVPVLSVRAELLNKNGEVIWATTKRVHPLSGVVDSASPEDIRGNPQLLRAMWTAAAQQAVLEMMEAL